MLSRFQIKKMKNGRFYFNLLSANGEVILTSQMYASKVTAKKGIASVRLNAPDSARYEEKTNKAGEHFFVLKAGNHQIIGSSEAYARLTGVKNGIRSVSKNATNAVIEDINIKISE